MLSVIDEVLSSKLCFLVLKNKFSFSVFPLNKKCTCPIFSVPITLALNPPLEAQNFADFEAAAITELSSIAMGIV